MAREVPAAPVARLFLPAAELAMDLTAAAAAAAAPLRALVALAASILLALMAGPAGQAGIPEVAVARPVERVG
jgi:hypothetical protein